MNTVRLETARARRPALRRAAWAACALALACPVASGQTANKTKGGLLVTEMTVNPESWGHGTSLHRFLVENPTERRRTIELELPGFRYPGEGIARLSGTLTVEAGATTALELPQPPVRFCGSGIKVHEPGYEPSQFSLQANGVDPWRSRLAPALLLSRALSGEQLAAVFQAQVEAFSNRRGGHSSGSANDLKPLRLTCDPEAWPDSWLAYSAFDGCLVADEDYLRFPDAVRVALREYAAAGGAVVLVGITEPPREWTPVLDNRQEPVGGMAVHRVGFGRLVLLPDAPIESWGVPLCQSLMASFEATSTPWRPSRGVLYGVAECMRDIPIGGSTVVPVNTFFFLLLAFSVVAGPLAVWLCAKFNRRIWLLWTVPAFGFLFSGLIFAIIFLTEGVTPTLRRQAVTLLDQSARQAVTLGAVGVYAPSALGDGLVFENRSEITPLLYAEVKDARIASGLRQRYLGGWIPPRMAAFFRVRRSEPRSERLIVDEKADGTVEVVNALGAPIEWVRLWNSAGVLHVAQRIGAGQRRVLEADHGAASSPMLHHAGRTPCGVLAWLAETAYPEQSPGWNFERTAQKAAQPCAAVPRTYVASLEGCPFLEDPLDGARRKGRDAAIVAGTYPGAQTP